MLRYYKTGRKIGLEGDGANNAKLGCSKCCTPPDGFAQVAVRSKEQRTAGARGDSYLVAMASEVTNWLGVSSNVLLGRAVAGDIIFG